MLSNVHRYFLVFLTPSGVPLHCIRLLFIMRHTSLWIMSAVGRGLDWLMQVQCCLSLDAASTHLMHSCCFGITAEIIYQSESAWGLSSLLSSITPFFMSSSTRSASGPTCFLEHFNSFWQGASVPPSKSPPDICSHCLWWLAGLPEHACEVLANYACMYTSSVTHLCLARWDPMDCSPPGSLSTLWGPMDYSPPSILSVHGITPARILEWVAISSSRGSSRPRDRNWVSCVSCIAGEFCTCNQTALLS